MVGRDGAPERIRTSDPQIRSLVLYPAELRAPDTAAGSRPAGVRGLLEARIGLGKTPRYIRSHDTGAHPTFGRCGNAIADLPRTRTGRPIRLRCPRARPHPLLRGPDRLRRADMQP